MRVVIVIIIIRIFLLDYKFFTSILTILNAQGVYVYNKKFTIYIRYGWLGKVGLNYYDGIIQNG